VRCIPATAENLVVHVADDHAATSSVRRPRVGRQRTKPPASGSSMATAVIVASLRLVSLYVRSTVAPVRAAYANAPRPGNVSVTVESVSAEGEYPPVDSVGGGHNPISTLMTTLLAALANRPPLSSSCPGAPQPHTRSPPLPDSGREIRRVPPPTRPFAGGFIQVAQPAEVAPDREAVLSRFVADLPDSDEEFLRRLLSADATDATAPASSTPPPLNPAA
jgi:hypothetical protein